jgi:multiple sugar transport system substrate-binding protein
MTLDSSTSLGSIDQVLARGHYRDVELAVAPTPAFPGASSSGGATPIIGGLHLVNRSSAAQMDGAWQYIKYLVGTASQAQWAAATGSVPVSRSAATLPAVIRSWDATPGYRVAYEQIASSPGSAASSGPLVGSASSIGDAVQSAMAALASGGSPSAELTRAASSANAAIVAYNKHV